MSKEVIICVDDEQIVLNSLNKQLQREFGERYDFEFAESGEETLELLEDLAEEGISVAMVISDQIMPGMQGDKLLTNIHSKHPKCIKLLLTGQAALDSAINAINNAGLYRYITKPWDEVDLLLTIQKGLDQYELIETLEKQVNVFQKFVPQQFLDYMEIKEFESIAPEIAKKMELSILFSDVRDFTTMSETMQPNETFNFLNSLFVKLGKPIKENKGFIDKFIGDAIMALFQDKSGDQTTSSSFGSVNAGIEMLNEMDEFNTFRSKKNDPPVKIGIGIHVGEVILGTVGTSERIDSTVVGDSVNIAARIEGLTKNYHIPLLISESVYNKIKDNSNYLCRFIDQASMKGKTQKIGIYDVYNNDPEPIKEKKNQTKDRYKKGVDAFIAEEFKFASEIFAECHQEFPEDKTTEFYLQRSLNKLSK